MDRKAIVNGINEYIQTNGVTYDVLSDLLDLCREEARENRSFDSDEEAKTYWFAVSNYIKSQTRALMTTDSRCIELHEDAWLFESPYLFESFLWYMEKDRPNEKKFYLPRRNTLKVVVEDLQALENGKYDFYGLSMPPRVGKSSICIFFLAWVMGRNPDKHNAMSGHSGMLAKGFYQEVYNLITSAEYHFFRIFNTKLESKSSEEYTINLGKADRFKTFTARGIEGTWTGAVDISRGGYLYVDDLVRDREESLSPTRLENLYQSYLNVLVDRKNDGAKEIMVATRWGLFDPLGKNEVKMADNPRALFRKIPALDENDESNFQYLYDVGFSTQYYKDLRARLDSNEWMAKYQQKPFLREGLLFPADELNYFNGEIPDEEHYIACACDPAWGGSDFTSMPIGAVYPDAVYIIGWVYNNGDKYTTRPMIRDAILKYKPQKVQFEANNGGSEYAEDIDDELRKNGFKTNITIPRASTKISKEGKIIQYAPDIKRTYYFLEPSKQPHEYQKALEEVTMYTQLGKNPHDDATDSLTQLFQLIDVNRVARIEPLKFRI